MSSSLWPHGLQHTRLPCPSLSFRACSDSCPLSQWCHPSISSSVSPFSCPQSFPASGSFPMRPLFTSGGQSIGASASVLAVNTVVKVTWTWSLSQNILLYTLKVFLIVTKHSPHTVAVTLAACGVTAEHKFLLLPSSQLHKKIHSYHSFSHLSIWFLSLSLYSWALSLFTERKPFRASLWKNPICQHHYSCTLGPLQEKGGWKSLALQQWTVDLVTETKWLRAGEAGTETVTHWVGQNRTSWGSELTQAKTDELLISETSHLLF